MTARNGSGLLIALLLCLLAWQSISISGFAMRWGEPEESALEYGQLPKSKTDPKKASYRLLFFGNSHTVGHDLPGMIAKMIESDGKGETVYVEYAGGMGFLEEAWKSPATRPKIESLPWTHVILQAQKYSQSGKYEYSTKEAVEMAKFIRSRNATVIFYPEWGQRGRRDEGKRIHELHESMAREASAVVAPVGLAWDEALLHEPSVSLHEADGNHQTIQGAFLTASVLYATITGRSPKLISPKVLKAFQGKDREVLLEAAELLTSTKYPPDDEASKK